MKIVTIKFTNEQAKRIQYYLCGRYKKRSIARLENLCKIAILKEVAAQAEYDAAIERY